jgi:hypothetical protein
MPVISVNKVVDNIIIIGKKEEEMYLGSLTQLKNLYRACNIIAAS